MSVLAAAVALLSSVQSWEKMVILLYINGKYCALDVLVSIVQLYL